MQKKVNVTVNNCKSGKFMDLTSKLTVNTYVISKCLLISHSVHLRISDISNLSSKVKSWVFQDILEKPQELVLFMVALVCSVFGQNLIVVNWSKILTVETEGISICCRDIGNCFPY